jgi:DNA-binding MarR family transcriptional regulator
VDRHVARWSQELEWLDPLDEAIVNRVMVVSRHAAQNRRAALGASDLPHAHFKVLLALRRLGEPYTASPSELAESLGLTRGALSSRLAPIEAEGLIRRAVDEGDRRRVHVTLTPAGHRAFEAHVRAESAAEHELLAALGPEEKQQLADLLRKVVLAAEA